MFADGFAELQRQRVLHPVKNMLAFLLPAENPGRGQKGQVLGHIGLAGSDGLDDLADGARLPADRLQDAQAHRLAQRPEPDGDQFQLRFRQKMVCFILRHILI